MQFQYSFNVFGRSPKVGLVEDVAHLDSILTLKVVNLSELAEDVRTAVIEYFRDYFHTEAPEKILQLHLNTSEIDTFTMNRISLTHILPWYNVLSAVKISYTSIYENQLPVDVSITADYTPTPVVANQPTSI